MSHKKPSIGLYAFVVSTLVMTAAVVAMGVYWKFIDVDSPLVFTAPAKVSSYSVQAGSVLVVEREFCITREVDGTITRWIENAMVYFFPITGVHEKPGCYKRSYAVDIPETMGTGKHYYVTKFTYRLNPLTTVSVSAEPIAFNVVKVLP